MVTSLNRNWFFLTSEDFLCKMIRRTIFRMLCMLLMLILVAENCTGAFAFCRMLRGECHRNCPARFYTFIQAPILCPESDGEFCCLRIKKNPTRTTTTQAPIRGCGFGLSDRIIGGVNARQCEYPWMVHIFRDVSPCGGSLIDDRHIITAGHCLSNVAKELLTITVGEYDTRTFVPRTEFIARNYRIFFPDSYRSQFYVDDIAIIKLDEPIDTRQFSCMSPICLPEPWRSFRGDSCTVVGWGVTRTNYTYQDPPLSPVLKKVKVDILDDKLCRDKFGNNFFRDTNYCAGDLRGGKDSCGGDSGGPLMCRVRSGFNRGRLVLAGLVSTGSNCAEKDTPAIYTDVAKYRDWIDDIVNTP